MLHYSLGGYSRVGGWVGEDFPRTPAGEPALLLAQINFAEVPDVPGFPADGLLQIFTKVDFEDFDSEPTVIYRAADELTRAHASHDSLNFNIPEYFHFETV